MEGVQSSMSTTKKYDIQSINERINQQQFTVEKPNSPKIGKTIHLSPNAMSSSGMAQRRSNFPFIENKNPSQLFSVKQQQDTNTSMHDTVGQDSVDDKVGATTSQLRPSSMNNTNRFDQYDNTSFSYDQGGSAVLSSAASRAQNSIFSSKYLSRNLEKSA